MKAEKISILIGILVIVLLAFLIVGNANVIGVSAGSLENVAREEQEIDSQWESVQAANENMCALLFYNAEKTDCRFSVYLTKDGLSYGYFFREGGADGFIVDGVRGLIFEDKGIALLSLNAERVCKILVDGTESIEVDPLKPFAVVLPVNCGEITLYDAKGNIVTLYDAF